MVRTAVVQALIFFGGFVSASNELPKVSLGANAAIVIAPGVQCQAKIGFVVAENYHIQANPVSEPYLIASKLTVRPVAGIRTGNPSYPAPRPYKIKGSPKNLAVYEGTFYITLPIEASAEIKPGQTVLRGSLNYQACNETTCFFPENIFFKVPVEVLPSSRWTPRRLCAK